MRTIHLLAIICTSFHASHCWKCLPRVLPPKDSREEGRDNVLKIPECMLNVRTVIFTKQDSNKPCWSVQEVQLLVARRVLQSLIPTSVPRNFKLLYSFFERSEHVLRSKLAGPRVRMYFLAYYDVVGGYIHSVVMPVLNEAFYAGNVDYHTVKNFHNLMGKIMGFLDTNGDGWAGPCDMSRIPTRVTPLPLHICRIEESCNAFVVTAETTKEKLEGDSSGGKNVHKLSSYKGGMVGSKTWNYCKKGFSKIPLPFLDDSVYPSAIAMPLKDHALFSLMSERSVNVLPKYYILAMRCLASPLYQEVDMVKFNYFFHKWIMKDVVPHLYDLQRWYPGFGGVMRVVETMNQRGLASNEHLPTTNRTPTCNRTYVNLKKSRGFSDNSFLYSAIGLTAIAGAALLIWIVLKATKGSHKKKHRPTTEQETEENEAEGEEGDEMVVNALVANLCNRELQDLASERRSFSSTSNVSRGRVPIITGN